MDYNSDRDKTLVYDDDTDESTIGQTSTLRHKFGIRNTKGSLLIAADQSSDEDDVSEENSDLLNGNADVEDNSRGRNRRCRKISTVSNTKRTSSTNKHVAGRAIVRKSNVRKMKKTYDDSDLDDFIISSDNEDEDTYDEDIIADDNEEHNNDNSLKPSIDSLESNLNKKIESNHVKRKRLSIDFDSEDDEILDNKNNDLNIFSSDTDDTEVTIFKRKRKRSQNIDDIFDDDLTSYIDSVETEESKPSINETLQELKMNRKRSRILSATRDLFDSDECEMEIIDDKVDISHKNEFDKNKIDPSVLYKIELDMRKAGNERRNKCRQVSLDYLFKKKQ